MTVGLIWAQSTSGVIGRDGGIPWRLPEDQARFKHLTMGHVVVMGRRTWESLPASVRPLPGRRNVILTRQNCFRAAGADVVNTIEQAFSGPETWVIGGAEIYALAMPWAVRCEVTEVDIALSCTDADVRAPLLDETWIAAKGEWQKSRSGLRYRFRSYHRVV